MIIGMIDNEVIKGNDILMFCTMLYVLYIGYYYILLCWLFAPFILFD